MSISLCTEQEFLYELAISSDSKFKRKIREATPEQIIAIIECVDNFRMFSEGSKQEHQPKHICNLIKLLHKESANIKLIIIQKFKLIRSILAEIFKQISFGEICQHFCQHG